MDVSNDNSSSTKEIIQVIPTKKELKKLKEKKERSKSPDMPKESLKDERAKMRVERSGHQNSRVKLLWKSDLNKEVIIQNFIDRFWEETEDDDSWNFFWASVTTIKQIFSGKSYVKLNDYQVLNHFPNFYELTRKDLMAKNIKNIKSNL